MAEESAAALLIVEKGIEEASVIPLDQRSYLVGNLLDADIRLANPFVSRRHAQIQADQGRYKISDLGSKNGTYVNGVRLTEQESWLNSGDLIEFGRGQVILRFQAWTTTLTLPGTDAKVEAGDFVVDGKSREVWVHGLILEPRLSRKEFDVLELLYLRNGEVCSKDDIAAHSWPERSQGDVCDQEIEQCIRRLRLRVEPDPSQPRYILTLRGSGYKFFVG